MKKTFSIMTLLSLLVFIAVSCGKKKEEDSTTSSNSPFQSVNADCGGSKCM